jgi:type IV secretory pathway VirB2 component (pilin)
VHLVRGLSVDEHHQKNISPVPNAFSFSWLISIVRGVPARYSREQSGAEFIGRLFCVAYGPLKGRTRLGDYAVMEHMLHVCLDKSPGTGENSRPLNRHLLPFSGLKPRGLPLDAFVFNNRENPMMKRFLCRFLVPSWERNFAVAIGLTLLVAVPAFAQGANSPWENAVNVLMTAFTSTIARGLSLVAIVVSGLTFAFGEGGSKRVLAGVLFGVGMAIAAVNFLAWLFPGA